jgi:hypothetical protein
MVKAEPWICILVCTAPAGQSVASAVPVQDGPQLTAEAAFDAVDYVLARKDLNSIPDYADDRNTPESLIFSFYNATNRGEFSRAYSYYAEGARPDFVTWVRGHEDTRSIKVITGPRRRRSGSGTLYWHQPVAIDTESYDGGRTVFGGCYEIRMAAPLNQEAPSYHPMAIASGSLRKSTLPLKKVCRKVACRNDLSSVGRRSGPSSSIHYPEDGEFDHLLCHWIGKWVSEMVANGKGPAAGHRHGWHSR